jgi:hypothetical protein
MYFRVYVDICYSPSELRSTSGECDLSTSFSTLYNDYPFPGFSIGPKDDPSLAGSFSGLITHTNEISGEETVFGLTCEHVVNGEEPEVIGYGPYKHDNGAKFKITMPAVNDHEETRAKISQGLKSCEEELVELESKREDFKSTGRSTEDIDDSIMETKMFEKRARNAHNQASVHDIDIGHVVATSGQDKSGRKYRGTLDWAIFSFSKNMDKAKNQVSKAPV